MDQRQDQSQYLLQILVSLHLTGIIPNFYCHHPHVQNVYYKYRMYVMVYRPGMESSMAHSRCQAIGWWILGVWDSGRDGMQPRSRSPPYTSHLTPHTSHLIPYMYITLIHTPNTSHLETAVLHLQSWLAVPYVLSAVPRYLHTYPSTSCAGSAPS